ncbi:MAG TPA: CoA transferase [Gammaproteobacteria bacterium]|nr:CoA transferase [Gammaproteobacteria bacterium]
MGSLEGLRVLDCTHVIAGAWCSMVLADLGADVVKVESPRGEVTRTRLGAFRAYDFVNRNKRAIAVDLAREGGRDTLRRLARGADVFVENYRPGAMAGMGLGYDDLAAENPGLIYCSVSGFGHDGPYRERGGLDLVAQAMSGIMSFTGEPGGERPVAAGVPVSDLNAGTFAVVGILAALAHRNRTGEGQHVETSLLESALSYTVWESGLYLTTGEVASPRGSRHRLAAPYEALRTGDGFIVVGVNTQKLWRRLCEVLGEPELADDARFAAPRDRLENRDALQAHLEALLASDTTGGWVERLVAQGIPAGPINDIGGALEDPQVRARGMLAEVDGRRFVRTPVKMSRTPVRLRRGPAEVGQDTRAVLEEAGFAPDEIRTLLEGGAVTAGEGEQR